MYSLSADEPAPTPVFTGPTLADAITLLGYTAGLWWAVGGPTWAGIASIVADELDGRVARATNTATQHGSSLDWGGDVALTPLALLRLGRETGHEQAALLAAPAALYAQAVLRGSDWRPPVGSARAVVMALAMLAHHSR